MSDCLQHCISDLKNRKLHFCVVQAADLQSLEMMNNHYSASLIKH